MRCRSARTATSSARSRGAPELVVVDPGDDAATLRLELARTDGAVAAILVTHTHYDHIGAVADLAEATGAPVYVSETEAQVVANPDAFYPAMRIRPWQPEHELAGDETLQLAGIEFQAIAVPGHSPGHLTYYADGSLSPATSCLRAWPGRPPVRRLGDAPPVGPHARRPIPADTVVYSGHGPPTTLGAELARNPFLAELRA